MTTKIKCPHCHKSFEPTDAYRHELEEKLLRDVQVKHKKEIEKIEEQAIKKAKLEVQEGLAKELKDKENQISSLKKRAEEAEEQELHVRKEKRELEESKRKFELEKQRQLDEEREKIRKSAQTEIEEIDRLKFAEYEKKLKDMSVALEEAKKKGEQGSQQLQGEVLELDLEYLLKSAFSHDEIIPVAKGKSGGDVIQKVRGRSGRVAGIILWETKRGKWKGSSWLAKLKENVRSEEANIGVLLSMELPNDIVDFQLTQGGVLVCSYKYAIPLATILRRSVLQIAVAKQTRASIDENLEMLSQYIQSEGFRHRFEAFAEGIKQMHDDLSSEKSAMQRLWKKREMQIEKTKLNAARMYGELQGVMGNSLPDIKTFQLESGESEEK